MTTFASSFGAASTAAEILSGVDLTDRKAIVTGASSGLGEETAKALAAAGAHTVLAVRDRRSGDRVAAEIRSANPDSKVEVGELDLSRTGSIGAFSAEHGDGAVDILVNNAGVMVTPQG